ncbi:MAG: hypothetical protein HY532_02945 [Chloroflexi bacterium]|nr:hypothetical protein [Chloroflexota bacterium]
MSTKEEPTNEALIRATTERRPTPRSAFDQRMGSLSLVSGRHEGWYLPTERPIKSEISDIAFVRAQLIILRSLYLDLKASVDELLERPIISNITLLSLSSRKYSLVSPLPVVIEDYATQVIARIPDISLEAEGETESQAIIELKRQIVELYEDLLSSPPETLGPEPTEWLSILQQWVTNNATK